MKSKLDDEVRKRLRSLTNDQKSIEKMSKIFIKYKQFEKNLVSIWVTEFASVRHDQKLAFLHLIHDILNRGCDSAPNYSRLFQPYMQKTFTEAAKPKSRMIRKALAHLLIVWAQREIYSKKTLRNLRASCQKAVAENDGAGLSDSEKKDIVAKSPFAFSFTTTLIESEKKIESQNVDLASPQFDNELKSPEEIIEKSPDDLFSHEDKDFSKKEVPDFINLINSLKLIQDPPSTDGKTRQMIAKFNPEISDPIVLKDNIKKDPQKYSKIKEDIDFINQYVEDYLDRLREEESNRKKAGSLLKIYKNMINSEIDKLQKSLHETNKRYNQADNIIKKVESHLASLPEFLNEPDVEIKQSLVPLPNLNDLFK